MDSLLENRNALIWAFNENIDKDTSFEGNTNADSIRETKAIITYLCSKQSWDTNITEAILAHYLDILANTYSSIPSSINTAKQSEYVLCGWKGHAILLFWEKQLPGTNYIFGLINCGQGIELQGHNGILCNGLIIFKNITSARINSFLITYKNYYNTTSNDFNFKQNELYNIFYFILFDKLLDIKEKVNFEELCTMQDSPVDYYKLESQVIGSCAFTNLINYIYFIYLKTQNGIKTSDQSYIDYNVWYDNSKRIIKEKILNDIIVSEDKSHYNMYQYILDTTDVLKNQLCLEYEDLIKRSPIKDNSLNYYHSPIDPPNIQKINREMIDLKFSTVQSHDRMLEAFWEIYADNKLDKLVSLLNEPGQVILNILMHLKDFFKECKLCDNNFSSMAIVFILYKLKKDGLLIVNIFTREILEQFFLTNIFTDTYKKHEYLSHQYINEERFLYLYLSIYLILVKENITPEQKYYTKSDSQYITKKDANISYYDYILFQYIPIINYFFREIIDSIINDLHDNIEILPDVTNVSFMTQNKGSDTYHILIEGNTTKIFLSVFLQILPHIKFPSIDNLYQHTDNIINFLLWFILVNNINDPIQNNLCIFEYERYGYYIPEIYLKNKDTNFILDTTQNSINRHPGGFKTYDQKIILFLEDIKKILNMKPKPTFEILKKYVIYFYLCELSGTPIDSDIFTSYDPFINTYFGILWYNFKPIIYTYTLKYNKTYDIPKNTVVLTIDDHILIPNIERKFFLLDKYECTKDGEPGLYHSVIDFYYISYSRFYKLYILKSEQNTSRSIEIIKRLLSIYSNIYLSLNFYFYEDQDTHTICGINKVDKNIKIEYSTADVSINNLFYIENTVRYKVIKNQDIPAIYKQFYNLITCNDISIFIYKNEVNNEHFLRTLNYDFIFTMKDDLIYYTINDIEYTVNYCNDTDIYNNYGILKLCHSTGDKLLCIYNYNKILELQRMSDINFINQDIMETKKKFENSIDASFKSYYYNIISEYNGKYIFTNIKEVLSLLINCLKYNSTYLILKNIEQIKIILKNNDTHSYDSGLKKFLNTLLKDFDNIYSIPILLLIYDDKELNEYYYLYANNLYSKYNISLKLKYSENRLIPFSYNNLMTKLESDQECSNLLYFQSSTKLYEAIINDNIIYFRYYIKQRNEFGTMSDMDILSTPIALTINKNPTMYNIKYLLEIKYSDYKSKDYKEVFCLLLKSFIPNDKFNSTGFEQNIKKATELFTFLIDEHKTRLYPIQELLMGSGKTTVLTPYICILLFDHFLSNPEHMYNFNNEIYIVMPESLINPSFEILMKHLFPIFNISPDCSIEISIYPNKLNYKNSFHIYLISDTNYKVMFLENEIDTVKKYMIYDEVDMMANPLTCELNKPNESKKLECIDELYLITNILYDDIFKSDEFWKQVKNREFNKIHNYIYNLDTETIQIVNTYYDLLVIKHFAPERIVELKNLIEYIKENVLFFILTKQFNFDYGMPDSYSESMSYNYKFKAIPYSAVDNPVMGSEFSDPILTYILTLFCYKIVDSKFRKIDKDYIINYLESICKLSETKIDDLFNLFLDLPRSLKHYFENKLHFIGKAKEVFKLTDENFNIITKQILDINNSYYSSCKNISFNDLLLSKNIKNFVCFTGTAYIKPPIGNERELIFESGNEITYTKVVPYPNVLDAVMNIICNEEIVQNLYINKNDSLITDIFCTLDKYDVLIDIGGIFIKYNINLFIDEYRKLEHAKEYIVYFDNGRKIYNLKTNQFTNDQAINPQEKNTFFYFSNKNITGVDAKNIMNSTAHGLVTITNNTNLRDFSQGIFRMRSILEKGEHQTFDIIFNEKIMPIIMKGGFNEFTKITHEKIRDNIIRNLVIRQEIIDKQKEKVLIKQNIFALYKSAPSKDNIQMLYIDPMTSLYNESIQIFKASINSLDGIINKYDIDSLNIIHIITSYDISNSKLNELIERYFKYNLDVLGTKQNMVEEQVEEQVQQQSLTVNQIISIPYNSANTSDVGRIFSNFKYNTKVYNYEINQILILLKFGNNSYNLETIKSYNLLLIYDNFCNNLILLTTDQLSRFLMYNENIIGYYTYISLYNKSCYGKIIDVELFDYLLRISLGLLSMIRTQIRGESEESYLSTLIQYLMLHKYNDLYVFPNELLVLKFLRVSYPSGRYVPPLMRGDSFRMFSDRMPMNDSEMADPLFSALDSMVVPPHPIAGLFIPPKQDLIATFIRFHQNEQKQRKKGKEINQNAIRRQQKLQMKVQQKFNKLQINRRGGDTIDRTVDLDIFYYMKYMKYKEKYIQLRNNHL